MIRVEIGIEQAIDAQSGADAAEGQSSASRQALKERLDESQQILRLSLNGALRPCDADADGPPSGVREPPLGYVGH